MGSEPKTVRYTDETVNHADSILEQIDKTEQDLYRDAVKRGLNELEREVDPLSSALVASAKALLVGGFGIGVAGGVTSDATVSSIGVVFLGMALGILFIERAIYRGGS